MSLGTKWSWIIWLNFIGLFIVVALIFVGENIIADKILKIILTLIIYYVIKVFFSILNPHKKLKNRRIRKKKISQQFLKIYDYVKKEYGKDLEEDRRKVIKVIIITIIIAIVILIFDIIFFDIIYIFEETEIILAIISFPFFMLLIFLEIQYSKVNKKYLINYKDNIIRNFIEYINPRLEYRIHAEEGLMDTYLKAGFNDKKFWNFKADDYIKGINKDRTRMEIANVICGNMNEKGNIPGYNTEPKFFEIYYEGIFSVTDLNYNLQKEIQIKKNKKTLKKIKNKVRLDNREFEKYFDVYADSEILALGLIGHAIMEQMIIFYKEFKVDFEVIIKNNKIYMRFDTGMMFEPNILKKSYNMKTLWLYYNILIFVTEITLRFNELAKDLSLRE